MAFRTFLDSAGNEWQAFDVVPRADERRRVDRRSPEERRANPEDRRDGDRRLTVGGRSPLASGVAAGWLCFERNGDRRRLCANSRRVGPIARTRISMATASPPGPCARTHQRLSVQLRQGSLTCSVRCASGEPKGPSDRVLHGRSQKTKAPRSARGAQQHPNPLANIVNRASHWASNAVGELTHSTASRCVSRREQKCPQLATTARGRVDVICDVLPESAFRHTPPRSPASGS